MKVRYKKFLPRVMQDTRWGELMEAYQSITDDVKSDKIDVIHTKDRISSMTDTEIMDMGYKFGYDILSFDGYTETSEYLQKELITIVPRMQWKTTRKGYQYLNYIFNLTGDVYPIYYTDTYLFDVLDDYWTQVFSASGLQAQLQYLDDGLTLDSIGFTALDNTASLSNRVLRHFVISYAHKTIETADEFASLNTQKVFYYDVTKLKRATEYPYFEPHIEISAPNNGLVNETTWYNYDSTISAKQYSYVTGILNNINHIQLGRGQLSGIIYAGAGLAPLQAVKGVDNKIKTLYSTGIVEIDTTTATKYHKRKLILEQHKFMDDGVAYGYQDWAFTTPKTLASSSGLSSGTLYSSNFLVDFHNEATSFYGYTAPNISGVINKINEGLAGAYAYFDNSNGTGLIRVRSKSYGNESRLLINNVNLFNNLTNAKATANPNISGILSGSQIVDYISEVAFMDVTGVCIAYTTFPKIRWSNDMFSNLLFKIQTV